MQAIPSAMQSARMGIQRSTLQMDRAAQVISRSFELDASQPGLVNAAATQSPPAPGREPEYLDAVVDMMLAQRAFTAQLRVIEAADQMEAETLHLKRRPPAA